MGVGDPQSSIVTIVLLGADQREEDLLGSTPQNRMYTTAASAGIKLPSVLQNFVAITTVEHGLSGRSRPS